MGLKIYQESKANDKGYPESYSVSCDNCTEVASGIYSKVGECTHDASRQGWYIHVYQERDTRNKPYCLCLCPECIENILDVWFENQGLKRG